VFLGNREDLKYGSLAALRRHFLSGLNQSSLLSYNFEVSVVRGKRMFELHFHARLAHGETEAQP
jgi:hypothetical protein